MHAPAPSSSPLDPLDQRQPSASWKWTLCSMLLLATMLNYMDRQTLSLTITDISKELGLNNEQYGNLEFGFGMAFAVGGLTTGVIVDFVSVRWMYPLVLIGWSLAGVATAYGATIGAYLARFLVDRVGVDAAAWGLDTSTGEAYWGLMVCRVTLGFFEAGQWPCALVTTQRLLTRQERSFGNSLLQSGAAIGAIFTPIVVELLVSDAPGSWRSPFVVIGLTGMAWTIPWLLLVRRGDLARPSETSPQATDVQLGGTSRNLVRRFIALVITVIMINMTWQFFRVWLPKLLREFHGYDRTTVNYFTSAYYIATDVGCISVGILVRWLTARGWDVHRARMTTFFGCALLTALSMIAAYSPRGPVLLSLLLIIGFGALGLFPNYYAFTQELTFRHQGKVTGVLGATTWIVTSMMQRVVGQVVDRTNSYELGIFFVGLAPLVAFVALLVLWDRPTKDRPTTAA